VRQLAVAIAQAYVKQIAPPAEPGPEHKDAGEKISNV